MFENVIQFRFLQLVIAKVFSVSQWKKDILKDNEIRLQSNVNCIDYIFSCYGISLSNVLFQSVSYCYTA